MRNPYNFNFWDVRNGLPRDMSVELEAVKRGYVFIQMNERGHFPRPANFLSSASLSALPSRPSPDCA